MLTNKGQALIELVIGFGILAIVLSAVTLLLISSREAKQRSANILSAENASVLQVEALRSVRDEDWKNLTNVTYHLANGPEYKVTVCPQAGCPPPLTEVNGSSDGSGEVTIDIDYPPQFVVQVKVAKLTDCSPECPETSTIKSMTLKNLTPNRDIRVLICNSGGCGVDEFTGPSNADGELTATFSYPEEVIVSIVALKISSPSDLCSGLGCLQEPTITNLTAGDFTTGTGWFLASGSETVGGFTRQVDIEDACRENGDIVDCPGTIDPSTKKFTSKVTWSSYFGGKVENVIYFTRHLRNTTWVQTTKPEFDNGTFVDTVSTEDTGNGEVILDTGADWSNPQPLGSYNNPGAARAFDVEVHNDFAYLVTGNGGGNNPDLVIIDVLDKNSPTERGRLNLSTDVNGVSVEDGDNEGHFAYLATESNSKELIVVDTSNKTSPIEAASLDLGNNQNALDIFLHGAKNKKFAYVTKKSAGQTNRELYIVSVNTCFDVTGDGRVMPWDFSEIQSHYGETGESIYDINGDGFVNYTDITLINQRIPSTCPHAPVPNVVGSFEPVGDGNDNSVNGIYLVGNTAYLATALNDKQLIAVDVSNKTSPEEVGFFYTGQTEDANDVFIFGQKAYLATENNSGANPEFYVLELNSSDPVNIINSEPLGTYDIDGTINAVFGSGGLAYLATNHNSKEFLVLNVSNPASISETGFLDLLPGTNDANGIYKVGNFIFLANDNNNKELQIIEAGGGTDFATEGTYESSTFDAEANVGFNYLTWTEPMLSGVGIKFQIATNDDPSTWNFVGPDGTAGSYYNSAGAIPLNSVSARYFRFKAILTGDGNETPILENITVNYSP